MQKLKKTDGADAFLSELFEEADPGQNMGEGTDKSSYSSRMARSKKGDNDSKRILDLNFGAVDELNNRSQGNVFFDLEQNRGGTGNDDWQFQDELD